MGVHGHIKDVMKRALPLVFVAALPLLADEPKSANTETAPAKTTATATTAAAAPAPEAQADSPLVAAAKRANRKNKKPSNLITNETLKTVGANAHVTTTATQSTIAMPKPLDPPRPTPEMAHARAQEIKKKALAEEAEKQKKVDDEKERKKREAAAAAEEGYDGMGDDASEFVGSNPPPPQF